MTPLKLLSACVLALVAGAAQAEIYRCKQANGQLSYQDTPCASGEQRKIDGPATARHDPPLLLAPAVPDNRPPYAEPELRQLVRDTVREEQGAAARKSCPTEHDIRKLEIDISSIQNRDKDRLQAELRWQLREAKACR